MQTEVKLSIVVPCYNEEKNVPFLVEHFGNAFKKQSGIELLLVDNGSKDNTGHCIEEEIKRQGLSFARKVHVEINRGYGFGILAGLKEAHGEVLAWTHADLQTDPADVLRAYKLYQDSENRQIFVKGYRENRKIAEMFFSLGMQLLSSLALGAWLSEVNAQPKLFSRVFYEQMVVDAPLDFSLDLYALYLAKKQNYSIISMPVYFNKRQYGEAKGGSGSSLKTRFNLIKRTFIYIFELRSKVKSKN